MKDKKSGMINTSQETPLLSLHKFQAWERVDGFEYEWYNGQLIPDKLVDFKNKLKEYFTHGVKVV